MVSVRDLTPELTALYGDYEWWVDRRGEGIGQVVLEAIVKHPDLQAVAGFSLLRRRGLVPYYETVGFERFDPEMEVPEGGTGELVRMTYPRD